MQEQVAQTTYSRGPAADAAAGRGEKRRRRASKAELDAWGAFLRAGSSSALAIEAALTDTGVSYSEYDVLLNVLNGARDGMRPTELAESVVITKSGLTRLVDRLVDRGYLERRACPSDRRGQLIVATADGRRAFRRAAPNVVRAIGTLFGGQFADDVATLREACERITKAAETLTPHP